MHAKRMRTTRLHYEGTSWTAMSDCIGYGNGIGRWHRAVAWGDRMGWWHGAVLADAAGAVLTDAAGAVLTDAAGAVLACLSPSPASRKAWVSTLASIRTTSFSSSVPGVGRFLDCSFLALKVTRSSSARLAVAGSAVMPTQPNGPTFLPLRMRSGRGV
jgi:hypothetical protein